jgi:hypothetical protein
MKLFKHLIGSALLLGVMCFFFLFTAYNVFPDFRIDGGKVDSFFRLTVTSLTATTANVGTLRFNDNTTMTTAASAASAGANVSAVQTSGTYAMAYNSYNTILVDTTSATVNATLPTAVGNKGSSFTIKKINSGGSLFTANTTSAQTIDGATSVNWTGKGAFIFTSDNSNWFLN